jgi:hypothetical protein
MASDSPGMRLPVANDDEGPDHIYLGVIPVAQAVRTGDLTLMVTMVERVSRYATLYVHMYRPRQQVVPVSGRCPPCFPRLQAGARYDVETSYRVIPAGSFGGYSDTAFIFELTPAIPLNARSLEITLFDLVEEDIESRERTPIASGPWSYVVDLGMQLDVSGRVDS